MEIWKPIVGEYEVSNLGRVRSLKYKTPHIIRQVANRNIYLFVTLRINGNPKKFTVHRLVATAFIPNPENKPQVNHINGDKQDNRADNLEWCTASENKKHAYRTGLSPQGEHHGRAKLTNEQVIYIRENPDKRSNVALAKIFNVCDATISFVQLGKFYTNVGGNIRASKKHTLTASQRAEIISLYQKGELSYNSLAKKFGVTPSAIGKIIRASRE